MKTRRPQHLVIGFLLGSVAALSAQTWNGSVNSLWSEGGNWSPSGVPASGANLEFQAVGNQLVNLGGVDRNLGSAIFDSATEYSLTNGNIIMSANGSGFQIFQNIGSGRVLIDASVSLTGNTGGTSIRIDGGTGGLEFAGGFSRSSNTRLQFGSGETRFSGSTAKNFGNANFSIGSGATSSAVLTVAMSDQIAQNSSIGAGNLTLSNGTLSFEGLGASISNQITVGSGNGTLRSAGALVLNGELRSNGSRTLTFDSGTFLTTVEGTVTSSSAAAGTTTFTLAARSNVQVNGLIQNNGSNVLSINKIETGVLTFSANNSYTGTTTVSAGRLVVNGNQSAATGNVNIQTNGTLAGSGTVGGITTISGHIAPGNSVGQLSFSSGLNFASGGAYEWEIGSWLSVTPGAGWDHLAIGGGLGVTATSGSQFTIYITEYNLTNFSETDRSFIIATAAGGVSGFDLEKFALDSSGFTQGAGTWKLDQIGNSLVLNYYSVIPEPSVVGLMALAGAWVLVRSRRQRQG